MSHAELGSVQIGIDTGGTYTDAVVLRQESTGSITIATTAKALTTKGDLSIGVTEALTAVLRDVDVTQVASLSISTTLATNAVVEGHGDAAAAMLIGFDDAMVNRINIAAAFPNVQVYRVDGGHDHRGVAVAPLDEQVFAEHLRSTTASGVRAVAIASVFAVRNPAHEQRAAAIIAELAPDVAVTMSSELSDSLDAPRRALTAVLNARLVGKIANLVDAVTSVARSLGLRCPIYVVKGDGTQADAGTVKRRPIETVASGPSASAIGAAALSGLRECIISDVGGTTTDLAVLRDGRPAISADGATIGGWRTLVRAADIRTYGLGGDSEVCDTTRPLLTVGPNRVVPVSLLAALHPRVVDLLANDLADVDIANSEQGRFVALPQGRIGDVAGTTTPQESELLALMATGPRPYRSVATSARQTRLVAGLVRRGKLIISALSVADAAHALGLQQTWSKEAAVETVKLAARVRFMRQPTDDDIGELARSILDAAIARSARVVMATAMGTDADGFGLLDQVADGQTRFGLLDVAVRPSVPIVAVGGPARLLYPGVGSRLGVEVVIPQHGEVANAVGAALGTIEASVTIRVFQLDDAFVMTGPGGVQRFADLGLAMSEAHTMAAQRAEQECALRGGRNVIVAVSEERVYLPERTDDQALLEAVITAVASANPSLTTVP
jgi:N-methylhydantoinase A/oxoprolinase/acetone carboxylase beta subunit